MIENVFHHVSGGNMQTRLVRKWGVTISIANVFLNIAILVLIVDLLLVLFFCLFTL